MFISRKKPRRYLQWNVLRHSGQFEIDDIPND